MLNRSDRKSGGIRSGMSWRFSGRLGTWLKVVAQSSFEVQIWVFACLMWKLCLSFSLSPYVDWKPVFYAFYRVKLQNTWDDLTPTCNRPLTSFIINAMDKERKRRKREEKLTSGILEAQVSPVPPGIFLSGTPEIQQNKDDSTLALRLHTPHNPFQVSQKLALKVWPKYDTLNQMGSASKWSCSSQPFLQLLFTNRLYFDPSFSICNKLQLHKWCHQWCHECNLLPVQRQL